MASIVQKIHKRNSTSRNVFDLSNNIDFVTCAGQLLPVRVDEVLPGSEFRFSQSYFMRTLPLIVPSFARIKVHFDNFFVPFRLLGTDVQSILVGNNRGMISNYGTNGYSSSASNKSLPYFNLYNWNAQTTTELVDAAGYNQMTTGATLLNALGYGIRRPVGEASAFAGFTSQRPWRGNDNSVVSETANRGIDVTNAASSSETVYSLAASILPLLAYQKIYQDYYRNKLWENENRLSYFIQSSDYGSAIGISTMLQRGILEMRYHDLDKDRLTGIVPDVSSILSQGLTINQNGLYGNGMDEGVTQYQNSGVGSEQVPAANTDTSVAATNSTLSALSLRRLEALQKFAEITELNKSDYKHQVAAHFGMDVADLNSDYCQYLGGFSDILNISDVENSTSEQPAALSGKGVSGANSRQFSFRAQEHGLLMTICYITPLVDYNNFFTERFNLKLNRYDFAIPELDSIGFEPVRLLDYYNMLAAGNTTQWPASVDVTKTVGYLPRYWDYKTRLDVCLGQPFSGDSKENSLNYNSYVVPFDWNRLLLNYQAGTMYKAFKVYPAIIDHLFPVAYNGRQDNSPFMVTFYDQCSAMLPLSVSGLPY